MNLIEKDMIDDEKDSSNSSDMEQFKRKNSNKNVNKKNEKIIILLKMRKWIQNNLKLAIYYKKIYSKL